jgi:hypothetical protein
VALLLRAAKMQGVKLDWFLALKQVSRQPGGAPLPMREEGDQLELGRTHRGWAYTMSN